MRFNFNATTREDALSYLSERSAQLLIYEYKRIDINQPMHDEYGEEWGVRTYFEGPDGTRYQAVYVYAQCREQGHYKNFLKTATLPIITAPQCGMARYLHKKGYPHIVVAGMTTTPAYKLIEEYYGGQRAERSQVFMMRHIDEGLTILGRINASVAAKNAYCLHPLVQSDEALAANIKLLADNKDMHRYILMLAMEYRNTANRTLSFTPNINKPSDIITSPIHEVNDMLIADKVQNYKDFLRYQERHPRWAELDNYFCLWLQRLGIDTHKYNELIEGM